MRNRITTTLLLAALALVPALAQADQAFDFDGATAVAMAPGDQLVASCVVKEMLPPLTTPIPLDFAAHEYTLVITAVMDSSTAYTQYFSSGTVALYEDDATPADPADPSSYTDGTVLLSGDLTRLVRNLFPTGLGAGSGAVDWTGGERLGTFAEGLRYGWSLLFTVDATGSLPTDTDETWEGTLSPPSDIVGNAELTWSELKSLY